MIWNIRLIAYIALASALAGSVFFAYSKGRQSGRAETQARWDSEKVLMLEAQGEQILIAQRQEQQLVEATEKLKKDQAREINRISAAHAVALDSLLNRPEARASAPGVSGDSSVGVGCTGAGLARPDAAFLVGYATDAARTQAALTQCVQQYEAARSLTR